MSPHNCPNGASKLKSTVPAVNVNLILIFSGIYPIDHVVVVDINLTSTGFTDVYEYFTPSQVTGALGVHHVGDSNLSCQI